MHLCMYTSVWMKDSLQDLGPEEPKSYFLQCLTIKNPPQEHKYNKEDLPKIQPDKTN